MSEWISVKTRLPDEGQKVLAVGKLGGMGVVRFTDSSDCPCWINTMGSQTMNPTHWMPLPEPPGA